MRIAAGRMSSSPDPTTLLDQFGLPSDLSTEDGEESAARSEVARVLAVGYLKKSERSNFVYPAHLAGSVGSGRESVSMQATDRRHEQTHYSLATPEPTLRPKFPLTLCASAVWIDLPIAGFADFAFAPTGIFSKKKKALGYVDVLLFALLTFDPG